MLGTRDDYAVRALPELAAAGPEASLTVAEFAQRTAIPPKYLENLRGMLRVGRIVSARREQGGGFHLARPAASITIAEVICEREGSHARSLG